MASFLFSPDTGSGFATYDQLKRRRVVAAMLAKSAFSATPKNLGEGLSELGSALGAALAMRGLAGQEKARDAALGNAYSGLLPPVGASPPSAAAVTAASSATAGSPSIPPEAFSPEPMAGNAPAALSGGVPKMSSLNSTPAAPNNVSPYANDIASIESKGSGGYSALGTVTDSGDRAYGKYQVMGANIPQWTKAALGQAMTPEQFLADPKAQDAVFQHQFGQYVRKYGPEGAAKAWFGGPGNIDNPNAADINGTTVADYAKKFLSELGPAQAQAAEVSASPQLAPGMNVPLPPARPTMAPAAPPRAVVASALAATQGAPQAAQQPNARAAVVNALTGNQPAPAATPAPLQAPPVGAFTPQAGQAPNISMQRVRPVTLPLADALAKPVAPIPATPASRIPPNVAMTVRKLIATGDPRGLKLAQKIMTPYLTPQKPVVVGSNLVDPRTGRVIYHGSSKPPKVVELYDDKTGQPYKAEYNSKTGQYERVGGNKAPSGMQLQVGPDGQVTFTQGAGVKPLTQNQAQNTGFLTRMSGALPTIDKLGYSLANLKEKFGGNVPVVGNYFKSQEYQRAEQAGNEFLTALLRLDSGAAVPPEELTQYGRIYLPQPGDTNAVIAQKKAARHRAMQGVKLGLPSQEILALEKAGVDLSGAETGTKNTPAAMSGTTQSGIKWSVH